MNQSVEDEDMDMATNRSLDCVDIDATVEKIFDEILDGPLEEFKKPLEVIKENKFMTVWRNENQRYDQVMYHANIFAKAVTDSFPSRHAEAAKHIKDSTCDLFITYVYKKLEESLLGEEMFGKSCKKLKQIITKGILRLKKQLETDQDELPESKSDLEIMISNTNLFDPIHIHHALLCCQVAYNCEDPETSNQTLESLDKEHLLSELSVSYKNENVPKYVMARCGNVLYVSFKGVQYHNFGKTERSYRGEINSGIIEAAKKIPLSYFAREILEDKRIVVSGHSSGGAIASLVLLFLLEKFKSQEEEFLISHFKCITFGLMPLADNLLKQYVEAIPGAWNCFCHIVQENDIVPKLFGTFNMEALEGKLWEIVENVLNPALEVGTSVGNPALTAISELLKHFLPRGREYARFFVGFEHMDIFGTYYILHPSTPDRTHSVLTSEEAARYLKIIRTESLRSLQSQHAINHKMERYVHEVELTLVRNLPDMKKFKRVDCRVTSVNVITPNPTKVRFQNIGETVVAKIAGQNMWFVYNISIDGVDGDGKDLEVNVLKSSEFEVQTRMRKANIKHDNDVYVRMRTHFHNSKFMESIKVPAKTNNGYDVSRRQEQLAKHSPKGVIELAYLSALLERRQEDCISGRFNAIQSFFEGAVSAVPLESLFHAMAQDNTKVVSQCCELFSLYSKRLHASSALTRPSGFLVASITRARGELRKLYAELKRSSLKRILFMRYKTNTAKRMKTENRLPLREDYETELDSTGTLKESRDSKLDEHLDLLRSTINCMDELLMKCEIVWRDRQNEPSSCNIDLEVIYPSAQFEGAHEGTQVPCCKTPMALLEDGREKLSRISEKLITEQSCSTDDSSTVSTNSEMLGVLNNLRDEFETCSTLLGAFMESQVQIPLENPEADGYVNKIAKHASSFGLSVWGILIVPFHHLNKLIVSHISRDFRQYFIKFSKRIHDMKTYLFQPSGSEFPDYDEKLEFLLGSMKTSWTCNKKYVSYSLERQLKRQCERRNIHHYTSVEDILGQWNDNFEDETLTLVSKEYRPLVARWIKWSLMINGLRESLASDTAIGVIGLVNSGKSKLVRSLFGEKTITGTTYQTRTTVPLIYNLDDNIKGLDVIDFPGVDDRDKSIPELAKLLLTLARIVVFVVDYRKAHTESTKEWLSILAAENVPVLICLTFADKLYAELMGEKGDCDEDSLKAGVEEQLKSIKEKIGQPDSGCQRDFKLTVFAFDNDSNLNVDENKEKLRKAGLKDELDVGRWIAQKLDDYEQNEVSQNVLKFIERKEKSTLNSHRRMSADIHGTEEKGGYAPNAKKKK